MHLWVCCRSLAWWYNGLPDYESVLLAAGSPYSELALVTETIKMDKESAAYHEGQASDSD